MSKIEGDIQPGEDLARDGVAIWPEPMQRMGTFSIFVGGLTGEYVILKKSGDQWVPINPKNSAAELKGVDEKDLKTLRKTLQLTYQVAGDEIRPGTRPDPAQEQAVGDERWSGFSAISAGFASTFADPRPKRFAGSPLSANLPNPLS